MIKVLVVDDHPTMRRLIRRLLSHNQHIEVVAEAASGDEALACVEEHKPDVMTLDMMMEGMNGIEVLRRLKKLHNRPKVIVLSLYNTSDLVQKAMEYDASAYIPKKELASGKLIEAVESLGSA